MIRTVAMFSGGKASWAAARIWVDAHGTDGMVLLFTDTNAEDPDLYRFLWDAADNLNVPLEVLANGGRTPWDVFFKERLIAGVNLSVCSRALKQRPARDWVDEYAPRAQIVMGLSWTEEHRVPAVLRNWSPHMVQLPLVDNPSISVDAMLRKAGLTPPRLYAQGFVHNNCGGACVRAGHGQWVRLLETNPARFAEEERQEEAFRTMVGKDVAILRDRKDGVSTPLTLRALRERSERQPALIDLDDIGGCGCMADD